MCRSLSLLCIRYKVNKRLSTHTLGELALSMGLYSFDSVYISLLNTLKLLLNIHTDSWSCLMIFDASFDGVLFYFSSTLALMHFLQMNKKTTKIRLPFRIKMNKKANEQPTEEWHTHTQKRESTSQKKTHTKFSGIVQRCTKHTKPYKAHNCQIHLICSLSKLSNIAHWFNKFLPLFSSYNDHTVVVVDFF